MQRTLVEDLGGTLPASRQLGDDIPAALLALRAAGRTPRRSCWAPRAARPGSTSSAPASVATVAPGLRDRTWTCTSSPTRRDSQGARAPGGPGRPARAVPARVRAGLVGVAGPALLAVLLSAVDLGARQRHAAVPGADGRGGPGRRTVAGAGLGGVPAPCCSTTSTPRPCTPWTVSGPEEHRRHRGLRRRRRGGGLRRFDLAARRTHQAARLRAESEILSYLAGNVLRGETGLEDLLERVRETFGMESAALLERAERRRAVDLRRTRRAGDGRSSGPRTRTWTCRSATTWRSR
ncbi:histidine kinase OS=Streptomyces griseomycini OX=66895 GN=FHS37_002525 PE=4 SV=1 [Streptomyces griseomycini]